jgi:hypothetical protein
MISTRLRSSANRRWRRSKQRDRMAARITSANKASNQPPAQSKPTSTGEPPSRTTRRWRAGCFRAVPEELRDQAILGGRELGRAAGRGARQEGLGAAVTGPHEPAANRILGDSQGRGELPLRPALLLQLQRSKPPPLTQSPGGKPDASIHLFYESESSTFFARRSVSEPCSPERRTVGTNGVRAPALTRFESARRCVGTNGT